MQAPATCAAEEATPAAIELTCFLPRSYNGSTADSKPENGGSIPSRGANFNSGSIMTQPVNPIIAELREFAAASRSAASSLASSLLRAYPDLLSTLTWDAHNQWLNAHPWLPGAVARMPEQYRTPVTYVLCWLVNRYPATTWQRWPEAVEELERIYTLMGISTVNLD